jgi:hypothetical protein
MAIKTNRYVCPNCVNTGQMWDGEEYVPCDCGSVEMLDSIIDLTDPQINEDDDLIDWENEEK